MSGRLCTWGGAAIPKSSIIPYISDKELPCFLFHREHLETADKGVVQVKHCILRSRKEISVSLSAVSGETISATPADFATFPQRQRFIDGFSLPNYL